MVGFLAGRLPIWPPGRSITVLVPAWRWRRCPVEPSPRRGRGCAPASPGHARGPDAGVPRRSRGFCGGGCGGEPPPAARRTVPRGWDKGTSIEEAGIPRGRREPARWCARSRLVGWAVCLLRGPGQRRRHDGTSCRRSGGKSVGVFRFVAWRKRGLPLPRSPSKGPPLEETGWVSRWGWSHPLFSACLLAGGGGHTPFFLRACWRVGVVTPPFFSVPVGGWGWSHPFFSLGLFGGRGEHTPFFFRGIIQTTGHATSHPHPVGVMATSPRWRGMWPSRRSGAVLRPCWPLG